MRHYILRRLAWAVPQILVVLVLVFLVIRILPGDPGRAIFGGGGVTQDFIEQVEERYHLRDPLPLQFGAYLGGLAHGDLGVSFTTRRPVAEVIGDVLPATLRLTGASFVVGVALGLALGSAAARRRGGVLDALIVSGATLFLCVPSYLLGLLFLSVVPPGLFPLSGGGWRSFVLPCLTLSMVVAGVFARVARSALLDVAAAEHVPVAAAKGLPAGTVWRRHVLRNALIPLTTLGGVTFGDILGGAVFVEAVFLRPGLGRLAVEGVLDRDFPVIQGIVLMVAVTYVLLNLLVDYLYGVLDPPFRESLEALEGAAP